MYFEQLWKEFASLEEISAIALGGSRATGQSDEKSDYDLYLYCDRIPPIEIRRELLERYCSYMETDNRYWETEDDCTLKDGVDIDILYRNPEDFENGLISVVEQHCAANGYTTCMWHNLNTCRILYDRDGALERMKKRFDVPYPEELRRNILSRGRSLLSGRLPSYDTQILKAAARQDTVALNHRAAAFMEAYFDVIFALNRMTHPGEKRMIAFALQKAVILPDDFEENINRLLHQLYDGYDVVKDNLKRIIDALDRVPASSAAQ